MRRRSNTSRYRKGPYEFDFNRLVKEEEEKRNQDEEEREKGRRRERRRKKGRETENKPFRFKGWSSAGRRMSVANTFLVPNFCLNAVASPHPSCPRAPVNGYDCWSLSHPLSCKEKGSPGLSAQLPRNTHTHPHTHTRARHT